MYMLNREILLLFILYTVIPAVLGQLKFDCRRLDNSCKHDSTCDQETGQCVCAEGYKGYACHIVDGAPCTDPDFCTNGECYVKDGENRCGCDVGFLGNKCEIDEFQVLTCDSDGLTVEFNFDVANFDGKIWAVSQGAEASNISNYVELPDACKSFPNGIYNFISSVKIRVGEPPEDGTEECWTDQFTVTEDPVKGKSTTITFAIQFLGNIATTLDLKFRVTCDLKKDDVDVYYEISNLKITDIATIDKNETYSPVKLEVMTGNGDPVSGQIITIGEQIDFRFYLTDTTFYKGLIVESCTANNTLESTAFEEFKVVNSGCPTNLGRRVCSEQTEVNGTNGNPGISLSVGAFMFVSSNKLGFVCKVSVCDENDTRCTPPEDCSAVRLLEGSDGTTENTTGETGGSGTDQEDGGAAEDTEGSDGGNGEAGGTNANGAENGQADAEDEQAKKRKRRATSNEKEQVVSTVLNIQGPTSSKSAAGTASRSDEVEQCFSQSEILAALIVLGSTVCILFIACFILCCLLLKRRRTKSSFGSVPSAKLSDRFHIPRAHVNESYSNL